MRWKLTSYQKDVFVQWVQTTSSCLQISTLPKGGVFKDTPFFIILIKLYSNEKKKATCR